MKAIVLRKPKSLKHKLHAVSPVVATLILIVVAIIGAIAVGLIVSNVANNTNKQANNQNAQAQTTLTIGGSTTVYPVSQSAVAAFEAEYPGVTVQVAQGGSGAGMEGVIIGAINIGEASSYPTASSYSASAAAQNPPVNLELTNIGGSGVVMIAGSQLTDGVNPCYGVTSAAAKAMFTMGQFNINAGACATNNYLTSTGVIAGTTWTAVSRSDIPSGTQETFGAWMGFSSSAQDSQGFGSSGAFATGVGNPGVLAAVEGNTHYVGFVDIGFAEGATALKAQAYVPALATGDTAPGTPVDCTAATVPPSPSSAGINCYSLSGESTSKLDNTVKNALSGAGPEFPDNAAGNNQLARTFWYATLGNPTPVEQDWINFITNPGNTAFFTNQGYYSVYQYKTG